MTQSGDLFPTEESRYFQPPFLTPQDSRSFPRSVPSTDKRRRREASDGNPGTFRVEKFTFSLSPTIINSIIKIPKSTLIATLNHTLNSQFQFQPNKLLRLVSLSSRVPMARRRPSCRSCYIPRSSSPASRALPDPPDDRGVKTLWSKIVKIFLLKYL